MTSPTNSLTVDPTLRLLASFAYFGKADLDALWASLFDGPPWPDLMADSGAWTAYSLGKTVVLQDYMDWLRRFSPLITTYANFDVIGDWRATRDNLHRMEDAGLHPFPIYHRGEPLDLLHEMVENYQYVAIGGIADAVKNDKATLKFVAYCHKVARGRCALHGFGNTYWLHLLNYPWYSTDGSSWLDGFRYGKVRTFDLRKGRFYSLWMNRRDSARRSNVTEQYGVDWKRVAMPGSFQGDRETVRFLTHCSYRLAEAWLRRRHGLIEIPRVNQHVTEQSGPGLKFYLAMSRAVKMSLLNADRMTKEFFATWQSLTPTP